MRRKDQNKKNRAAYIKKHGGSKIVLPLEKEARETRRAVCAGLQGKLYNLKEMNVAVGKKTDRLFTCEDDSGVSLVVKMVKHPTMRNCGHKKIEEITSADYKEGVARLKATYESAKLEAELLQKAGHSTARCGAAANIVLPLAEHSLHDWVEHDGVPPMTALEVARGVDAALVRLHGSNASHGDLGGGAAGTHLRFAPAEGATDKGGLRVVLIDFDKGSVDATDEQKARDRKQAASGLLGILRRARVGGVLAKEIGRRLRQLKDNCTLADIIRELAAVK